MSFDTNLSWILRDSISALIWFGHLLQHLVVGYGGAEVRQATFSRKILIDCNVYEVMIQVSDFVVLEIIYKSNSIYDCYSKRCSE